MRTRFILVAIVSLLFCSLSTLETPEFIKLTDDTSNDFSILIHCQETTESICNPVPIAPLKFSQPRPVLIHTPIQLRAISSSLFAPDVLHFICIERT